nr:PREDICTED: obscurin-like [Latimeria chalumnae]|eukprot:XP_014350253.1 PREDICTED: obscurin-like [Latimeria chalumnae]
MKVQESLMFLQNKLQLCEGEKIQLKTEGQKHSLVISNVADPDTGVYTCTARNAEGEVSCKAELSVLQDQATTSEKQDDKIKMDQVKRRKLHSFYEVKEEIGRGCFGFVRRVIHKGNGTACAAKFIPLRNKNRPQAYQERDIQAVVSHPRVTRLLDMFETRRTLVLILDLCSSEKLLERILNKGVVTEVQVRFYIRQILESINYLHDRKILHLDIKPANILMVHPESEDIKLCDFGFAQTLSPLSEPQYNRYGAPEFVSPEIVHQAPVSTASDIWPVGVITYLCLTCMSPFAGENDRATLLNVKKTSIAWNIPEVTSRSPEAQEFMKSLLQRDPRARPTASECLKHTWFLKNLSTEEACVIPTKKLKFLVARSKWQCSLMCYKSIMVMRSIPELLEGTYETASLGVPRHLAEDSSSSATSGSSSDYEDLASQRREALKAVSEIPVSQLVKQIYQEKFGPLPAEQTKACLLESAEPTMVEEHKSSLLRGSLLEKTLKVNDGIMAKEFAEDREVKQGECQTVAEENVIKSPSSKVVTLEASDDLVSEVTNSERGPSSDYTLPLRIEEKEDNGQEVRSGKPMSVPRQSLITSTFYESECESFTLPTENWSCQDPELIKSLERTRRNLMKAGYSRSSLSGLREPLLEHIELCRHGRVADDGRGERSLMTKSASFDTGDRLISAQYKGSRRRSRSLDDWKPRVSNLVYQVHIEEDDVPWDESSNSTSPPGVVDSHYMKQLEKSQSITTKKDDPKVTEVLSTEEEVSMVETSQQKREPSLAAKDSDQSTGHPLQTSELTSCSKTQVSTLECIRSDMVCLSEELDFLPDSKSVVEVSSKNVTSEAELCSNEQSSQTVITKLTASTKESDVKHAFFNKGVYVESTTPVSAVKEVSDVMVTQYGFERLRQRPRPPYPFIELEVAELEGRKCHLTSPSKHNLALVLHTEDYVITRRSDSSDSSGLQLKRETSPVLKSDVQHKVLCEFSTEPSVSQFDTIASESKHFSLAEPTNVDTKMNYSQWEPVVMGNTTEECSGEVSVFPKLLPLPGTSEGDLEREQTDTSQGTKVVRRTLGFPSVASETTALMDMDPDDLELCGDSEVYENIPAFSEAFLGRLMDALPSVEEPFEKHQPVAEPECSFYQVSGSQALPGHLVEEQHLRSSEDEASELGVFWDYNRDNPKYLSPAVQEGAGHVSSEMKESEEPHGPPAKSHQKASDFSVKERVKASVSNISRFIRGKQAGKKEKRKVDTKQKSDVPQEAEPLSASTGSLKRKYGFFSFKISPRRTKEKAPSFLEELSDKTVVWGQSVTLSCRASGQPTPEIRWFKDGGEVRSCDGVLLATAEGIQLLTVLSSGLDHLGTYKCLASNVLGQASTSCVLSQAEVPTCPFRLEVAQVFDDGALVIWKPVDSNAPITYILQGRKEGEEWKTLASDIPDCCCYANGLSKGGAYSFRAACVSKAGAGPYSEPCVPVTVGEKSSDVSPSAVQQVQEGSAEEKPAFQRSPSHPTYTFQTEINRGRHSIVKQCREKSSGRLLATKIIPYRPEKKQMVLREFEILKQLQHTNIVQLCGAFLSPRHLALVMELCAGKEALKSLAARAFYSELEIRELLRQVLCAVEYLHENCILHLDLRSENVIVMDDSMVKILDFGSAQVYSPDIPVITEQRKEFMESKAPETLEEGRGAVPPTDIWAVGVLTFIMLSAEYPFGSDMPCDMEKDIKKGRIRFGRCYAGLSGGAISFLKSSLCPNPWGRLSASECLSLPWLQSPPEAVPQQAAVHFSTTKLKSFVKDREKRMSLLKTKHSMTIPRQDSRSEKTAKHGI